MDQTTILFNIIKFHKAPIKSLFKNNNLLKFIVSYCSGNFAYGNKARSLRSAAAAGDDTWYRMWCLINGLYCVVCVHQALVTEIQWWHVSRATRVIVIICAHARDQDQASTQACQLVVTSVLLPRVQLSSCGCLHVSPFCPRGWILFHKHHRWMASPLCVGTCGVSSLFCD